MHSWKHIWFSFVKNKPIFLKVGPNGPPPLSLRVNRPGVAGAVLQTPSSLINWFIHSVSQWSFPSKSSKHHISQKKLTQCSLPVMCQMSHVTCHVSHVTCHMSHVTRDMSHFFFFFFFLQLFGVGSVINRAYPV